MIVDGTSSVLTTMSMALLARYAPLLPSVYSDLFDFCHNWAGNIIFIVSNERFELFSSSKPFVLDTPFVQ